MGKSVDQRRSRRQRYISVVNHFRIRYGVTAAEVYPLVTGIEQELQRTKEALATANERCQQKDAEIKDLKVEIEALKNPSGPIVDVQSDE